MINKITFKSDNLNIKGEIHIPENGQKLHPAVCLCHGIPAVTYNPGDRSWAILAERFCTAGFAAMIFNFRGSGLSEGNFDMPGWANDLTEALNFLSEQDYVDKKRLYLLGSSGGAATSIYVAARDKRIAGVVTLACPAEFSFVKGNQTEQVLSHFRDIGIIRDKDFPPSLQNWLNGFEEISPLKWIDKISPRPLLLIHGDKDDVVPVEQSHKLYEIAKEPKELVIINGASHRLRLEERAVAAAQKWLTKLAELTSNP